MTKEQLRERHKQVLKSQLENNPDMQSFREGMKAKFGIDYMDEKAFPVLNPSFSWAKMKNKIATDFKEADTETALVQFTRAGLQVGVQAAYEKVETSYADWVLTISSKRREELYAPNHGVAFPREVGPSSVYPEVGVAALDLKLLNRKFGAVYALEKELLEDDQSGSFAQQSAMLGEYLGLLTEVYVYGKLASVANMAYIDLKIPQSETKPSYESVYPWAPAATPLKGGGITRPTSFGLLTSPNIQAGVTSLGAQKNLQGIRMMARPTSLLVGVANEFNAKLIMNSSFFPNGQSTTANVGTGGFAENVMKGSLDVVVTQFMFNSDGTCNGDSLAWYLASRGKGFILQLRSPVMVEQEAPNSGDSFSKDILRFKASTRLNSDFVDPRFMWQGNDGSVTS